MDAASALTLVGAGLAGGVVTAIVGGASLITFPAMLAVGLPPVVANASNTVALAPANLIAAFADRSRMPPRDPWFWSLVALTAVGSMVGAVILLVTPERAFTAFVPVLIGGATALFAASGRITRWLVTRRASPRARRLPVFARVAVFAPVAVYGGYFGAGMSIMLLAMLSAGFFTDLRTANVTKNLLAGLTSVVAVLVFVTQAAVAWGPTALVMIGGLVGGFIGGHLARVVPAAWVRAVVIAAGTLLTVVYARRYWFG